MHIENYHKQHEIVVNPMSILYTIDIVIVVQPLLLQQNRRNQKSNKQGNRHSQPMNETAIPAASHSTEGWRLYRYQQLQCNKYYARSCVYIIIQS